MELIINKVYVNNLPATEIAIAADSTYEFLPAHSAPAAGSNAPPNRLVGNLHSGKDQNPHHVHGRGQHKKKLEAQRPLLPPPVPASPLNAIPKARPEIKREEPGRPVQTVYHGAAMYPQRFETRGQITQTSVPTQAQIHETSRRLESSHNIGKILISQNQSAIEANKKTKAPPSASCERELQLLMRLSALPGGENQSQPNAPNLQAVSPPVNHLPALNPSPLDPTTLYFQLLSNPGLLYSPFSPYSIYHSGPFSLGAGRVPASDSTEHRFLQQRIIHWHEFLNSI
jgi:hypothetical protein